MPPLISISRIPAREAVEKKIRPEAWMTAPFETALGEQEIALESWMMSPFETTGLDEQEIALEAWMTAPFETALGEQETALEPCSLDQLFP